MGCEPDFQLLCIGCLFFALGKQDSFPCLDTVGAIVGGHQELAGEWVNDAEKLSLLRQFGSSEEN